MCQRRKNHGIQETDSKKLLISVLLAAAVVLITHAVIAAEKNRITSLNVVTLPLLMNEEQAQELLVEMWTEIEPEIYDLFDRVMDWSMETEAVDVDPAAFGAGCGRALLCYSEKIWQTGLPAEDLVIRPISFADAPNIPLAYLDFVAISDWVKDEKRFEKCLELVNLMTGKEYIERLLTYQGKPQYFVPARNDVFREYAEKYPLYAELYGWLAEKTPYQFRAGNENLKDLLKWVKNYRKKWDEEQLAAELESAA